MKFVCRCFIFLSIYICPHAVCAQQIRMPVPVKKSATRQAIDAKRSVANMGSKDAIYRAREFIRMDSTYYVGWMFEGVYKYNHAADFLGFKNAIAPLLRAFHDLSRDYSAQLRTRTSDLMRYYPAYGFQVDYTRIAALLMECYSNINQPQKAFQIALAVKKWNFQRDYFFPVYANMSWIVHRNRYYNHAKYSFLKNSIQANETLANHYLNLGLAKIKKDARINGHIFRSGWEKEEKETIYHYKAILFSYALDIDSAKWYYERMMDWQGFSYNNYATFLSVCGDFAQAMHNYNIARNRSGGDKRLQEWAYYSSILNIYKGNPSLAELEMKQMIKAVGSTPGFGWYNIALARAESYDGNLSASEKHALTASDFKEVNIGTTLGESQYNFSVNLVTLMNDIRRIRQVKFENSDWWYNAFLWPELSKLTGKKYLQQYLLVNQLALNPERDRVIYSLFSSENTVSWDEIWYLIRDFSTGYFYKKFAAEFQSDKRPRIKKYYLLFMAKLQIEQGKYKAADAKLHQVLQYPDIDPEYGKLFLARTYEAMSICAGKLDKDKEKRESSYNFYKEYAQMVPFSTVEMDFNLQSSGHVDKAFISKIKDFRINWTDNQDKYIPKVKLVFQNSEGKKSVIYSVTGMGGEELVAPKTFYYTHSEQAAVHIAYALFGIEHQTDTKS